MPVFVFFAQLSLVMTFIFVGIGMFGQLIHDTDAGFFKLAGQSFLSAIVLISIGFAVFIVIPIAWKRLYEKKISKTCRSE